MYTPEADLLVPALRQHHQARIQGLLVNIFKDATDLTS